MELTSGIKVYLKNNLSNDDRLFINSGSKPINGSYCFFEDLYFNYKNGAYVPKNDWRPLSPKEEKIIMNSNELINRDFLEIGKLPTDIIDYIKKLNLHDCNNRNEVFREFENNIEIVKEINSALNTFLTPISDGNEFEFYKIVVFPENIISNGISKGDNGENVFLGMHIDRSTKFDIETASLSKNRICINISKESRQLYIINLSLSQIKKILKKESLDITNIVDEFFNSKLATYPVLKVKINPYEYYIAPTDNYIHDGTTINRSSPDITLTYLGKFTHI